jgi:hypothetical protein
LKSEEHANKQRLTGALQVLNLEFEKGEAEDQSAFWDCAQTH